MASIHIQVLLLICLSTTTLVSARIIPQNFTITKPDCLDRCGNISIPFPFGTSESCYSHVSFLVTCNTSFDSPKLFMQDRRQQSMEVTDISLDGQVTLLQSVAKSCFSENGTRTAHTDPDIQLPNHLTVNNTANMFTILGCDTYGYLSGGQINRNYVTGCITRCSEIDDLVDGTCGGLGCCQITSIARDVWRVKLDLQTFDNHTRVWEFNDCSYGFLVEAGAYEFYRDNLTNFKNVEQIPFVADWAIGNETCEVAQMNSSSYACKSLNSRCYMPDNGVGYRCRCNTGYQGNPYLIDGCQDINECDIPELSNCAHKCENSPGSFTCYCRKGYHGDGSRNGSGCNRGPLETYRVVAGVALGNTLAMLIIYLLYMLLKKRRSRKMKYMFFLQNGGMLLQERLGTSGRAEASTSNAMAKIFSSTELRNATNNFDSGMIVGQGGFGTVYKGFLENTNMLVAVKKSREVDPSQIDQFINEIVILSRISHRNVVRLLGCCLETHVPLLVYEFINNGTLHDHIHDHNKKRNLCWNFRLKIAIETADVLSYLHSTTSTPIIHRDVKSSNILLDHDFSAKVADFGASRLIPVDHTRLSTMVQGTLGYLDPEYMQTNQLTEKSDVYSFGVVLVELITAMEAIDFARPEEEINLANLFLCKLKAGRLFEILDETIMCSTKNMEQLTEVSKIARVCLNVKGEHRPSMKEVATALEGLRSGGKQSWDHKLEQNAIDDESFSGKGLNAFFDIDGHSTGTFQDILRDHTELRGGR